MCKPIKNKKYTVYTGMWFSSPALSDHLLSLKTEEAGTVMTNKKQMLKQTFAKKL
jgi:hypothetical protein